MYSKPKRSACFHVFVEQLQCISKRNHITVRTLLIVKVTDRRHNILTFLIQFVFWCVRIIGESIGWFGHELLVFVVRTKSIIFHMHRSRSNKMLQLLRALLNADTRQLRHNKGTKNRVNYRHVFRSVPVSRTKIYVYTYIDYFKNRPNTIPQNDFKKVCDQRSFLT